MKRCPQCQQTFDDDTFYCLNDGTPLPSFSGIAEEETVVRPLPPIQSPPQTARQGVNPAIVYLSIGFLGLLVLIGGAVILFLLLKPNNTSSTANNKIANVFSISPAPTQTKEPDTVNQQKANLDDRQAALEREKQKLADEREKLEAQKNKSADTSTYTPSVAQPTARISFQRGSAQATVSGTVAGERSYVLAARSGQYLSASVSGGGCVTFSNGSTSTGYTTGSGDNRVTVVNKCGGQSSFSLTVSIR